VSIKRSMLSLREFVAHCGLAALQGVLVVLPRPAGSAVWGRLRSHGWTVVLPSALVVGTFGVLELAHGARWLAVLAGAAAPPTGQRPPAFRRSTRQPGATGPIEA
jgi:hypothetical protein